MFHASLDASNYKPWSADRRTEPLGQDVPLPPPSVHRSRAVLPPRLNGGKSHGQFTVRLGIRCGSISWGFFFLTRAKRCRERGTASSDLMDGRRANKARLRDGTGVVLWVCTRTHVQERTATKAHHHHPWTEEHVLLSHTQYCRGTSNLMWMAKFLTSLAMRGPRLHWGRGALWISKGKKGKPPRLEFWIYQGGHLALLITIAPFSLRRLVLPPPFTTLTPPLSSPSHRL
ncbi:uncharacterized protein CTRU02_210311 [Colletotrichum truncatum]|uniref:Uncharacterized protein n=1 Tax=Colletotrichum truncatum TaxID=5467 RepID=A0ACC3YUW5_COLTU|nr:uncharacterized protein CTRU02_11525 [Colletotrichum truncatum]KAF6785900.1 hypothetical protein CTRU02_11525 [Colletotrichum truncatum]